MDEARPERTTTGSLLEELVFEYLERRESEGDAVLEELCAEHPEQSAALRKHVAAVRESGFLETASEESVPERLGDFRLLERLGAGGMGIVYRAHEESLDREVALKLVRPEQLYFGDARARFQREVMVVARLNHPGIVPVYSIGEENGLPFFVMERIHGATLAQILGALKDRDVEALSGSDLALALEGLVGEQAPSERPPLFSGTWEQTCLRVAREVAEALTHAHRLGVLHRDIKPSNVMITPEGRVMLLDFGLSSEEGAERLTRTGSAVGSLPYMAPELFDGSAASRASDVFGLGAMLFELLTFQLPIAFKSPADLRARILAGEVRRLRPLNARVSWESETVCLKALERETARRYVSTEDVARDLTNVLERRPIQARRAGLWLRSHRWVQRHTAASVALVLAASLLIGGPITYATQQRSALRRIEAESQLAHANLRQAIDAIHSSLSEIARLELRDVPQAAGVRQSVMETAIELFDGLALTNPDDIELSGRLAEAWVLLGSMQREVGRYDVARESFDRAHELELGLVQRAGENSETSLQLGQSWFERAALFQDMGDPAAATEALNEALGFAETVASEGPRSIDRLILFGLVQLDLGRVALGRRDLGEAEERFLDCIASYEDAYATRPEDVRVGPALGRASRLLADVHQADGRVEEARIEYRLAIQYLEECLEQHPESVFERSQLATAFGNLGAVLARSGEFEAGREALGRALEIHEALALDYPHEYEIVALLGANHRAMGSSYVREGRPGDALEHYEASLGVLEPLVDRSPEIPDVRHHLAETFQAFAVAIVQQAGERHVALELIDRAIELEASALDEQPGNTEYRDALDLQRRFRAELDPE